MNDSIHTIIGLADTIKVLNLTHTQQPFIPLEYLGLFHGVLLGAVVSTLANYLLSKSNYKIQLKNVLFQSR